MSFHLSSASDSLLGFIRLPSASIFCLCVVTRKKSFHGLLYLLFLYPNQTTMKLVQRGNTGGAGIATMHTYTTKLDTDR